MRTSTVAILFALTTLNLPAIRAAEPTIVNTEDAKLHPPAPAEALKKITVPEGFRVTLFAAEPDVRQPIAMAIDDRGRLWVAECYSYPQWKEQGNDRLVIFEDTNNDGQFDSRKIF